MLGVLAVVVAVAVIVAGVALAAPTSYPDRGETITFPQGDDSFADEVVSFNRATNANGSATTNGAAASTLGRPDGPDNTGATVESPSLGDGGAITLRWTDNALTGSGNANPDLHIYERGTQYEDTHAWVSPDGQDFTYVGRTTGGQPGKVNIDTVPATQPDGTANRIYSGTPGGVAANGSNGFGISSRLTHVRVLDVAGHLDNGGAFAGADIDAVGAIETVLLNDAPVNTVPAAQTTNEDTARIFNTANANAITVADRDAATNPVRVTLMAANGTLAPGATTTGVTVTGSGTSTLTLTGNVTNVNTALNGLSFTPAPNYNGPATLTVTTNDQGNTIEGPNGLPSDTVAKEDVDTVAITVNPVNDAPVITTTAGALAYVPSDPATVVAPGATVSDPDSTDFDIGALTVRLSAGLAAGDVLAIRNEGTGAGQISVDTATRAVSYQGAQIGTYNKNGGTGANSLVITFDRAAATPAAVQALARNVTYRNTTAAPSGSRTVEFVTTDGDGGTSNAATKQIAISNRPTISNVANQTTNEDTATPPISFTVGDAETPVANLTVNGGSSNTTLVPNGNITFGGAGANRAVTITPAPNQNGTTTITLTVTDASGLTSTDTFVLTVNPVNDAPGFDLPAGPNQTVNEDSPVQSVSGFARNISKGPSDESGQNVSFAVSSNNSALFTAGGQPAVAADGTLTYTPAANANGTATVTVVLRDDGSNIAPNDNESDPRSFTIAVSAVNDAPVITSVADSGPKGEGTPVTVTVGATDIDTAPGDLRYQFDCNNDGDYTDAVDVGPQAANAAPCTFPDNGTSRVNVRVTDAAGGSTDSFTNVTVTNVPPDAVDDAANAAEDGPNVTLDVLANDTDVAADPRTITSNTQPAAGQGTVTCSATQCVFDPSADFNGTTSFQYTVSDGDGGTDTATVTITVAPVNDPPVLALPGNAVAYAENAAPVLIDGGATVADVDSANFDTGTLTVDLSASGSADDRLTISQGGGITVSGNAVSYLGTQIGTVAGGTGTAPLVVTLDADATQLSVQALARRIAFSNVSDDPSTAARTVRFVVTDGDGGTSAAVTETINVNAANDAPTISDITNRTILEDADTGDVAFTVADPDSSGLNVSGSSSDTTLVPDGNIAFGGSGANRTVKVTPAANRSGGPVTVTVRVSDGSQSATDTFQLTVTPVNDAPSFDLKASPDQTVDEDAGIQTVTNLAANASAGPFETQNVTFEVTGNTNPSLFSAAPTIASNGNLTYGPAANASGTATITVRARDDGGTANGGVDASATRTFTIAVDPVNDAPVVTSAASLSVTEDVAMALTGISASDVDAGSGETTLTLSVPSGEGTLSASDGGGVTVAGSGSRRLTLTGSVANINAFAAADEVRFTTAQDATAPVTLTITADDDGNTGSGGAMTGTTTTTLNVATVNDAPINSVPGPRGTDEDTALVFSGVSTSDVDAQSGEVRVALSVTKGVLTLSRTNGLTFASGGDGQSAMTFTGSLTDVNAALDGLRFDPSPNYDGPARLTVTTDDQGNSGSGGAKSDTDAFDITVTPVNDRPVADPDGPYPATEDTTLNVSAANGVLAGDTDAENTPLVADLVTAPARGTLTLNPDGSFAYEPAANDVGPVTFAYRACEQGSNPRVCSDERTITIAISAVNDSPTVTPIADKTILEDSNTGDLEFTVSDPDAPAGDLTLAESSSDQTLAPSAGVTFGGAGASRTVKVTPAANRSGGPARVTVTVSDGAGPGSESATRTFDLNVTPVNDAPSFTKGTSQAVAEDAGAQSVSDWATAISEGPFEDQAVSFRVTNDDNGLFTAGGQPAVASDGTLTYTPAPNATGTAVVKVEAADDGGTANGGADVSTEQTFEITINPVNDAPVVRITAPAGSPTFREGPPSRRFEYTVDETDGPNATVTESCGTGGTKVEDEQGDPATNSFRCLFGDGPATPTVSVTADDNEDADNVDADTVEVRVDNIDPAVAAPDDQSSDEGENKGFGLGSFTDPGDDGPWAVTVDWGDGSPDTTFASASPGSLGSRPHAYADNGRYDVTVTVTEAGAGTPPFGSDSFGVTVANAAPTAADDAPTASPEGGTVTVDVLANDTDSDGDQLTVTGSTDGRHGTVGCTPAGSCVYKPKDVNFFGTDSFEYTISDGDGGEDTARVDVAITEVNDAPQGADDAKTTQRDQPLVFPARDVLGNDNAGAPDEAGQTLTVTGVGEAVNGLVTMDDKGTPQKGDDTITFTPASGYDGNGASFKYTVCDDGRTGGAPDPKCQVVTVRITVTVGPVNSAPVATDDSRTMNEDASPITVNFAPLVSDDETADTGLSYDVSIAPADAAKGTLSGSGSTRTFTPARNFNGTVDILYTVTDRGDPDNCGLPNATTCAASRTSEQKKVTVTVDSVNDAVVAENDTGTTPEDTALSLATSSLTANDGRGPIDEANQTLTVTGVANPRHGTVSRDGDRVIFTPAADYSGPAGFTYTVCDNGNPEGCAEATVNLEVTPVNDAPVARDDRASTGEAAAVSNSFISQYASSAQSTPTRLHRLNTAKEPYTLDRIGGNIVSPMNALGYRSTNRSLYGYRLTRKPGVVKVNPKTGVAQYLGVPRNMPAANANGFIAGDVSPNGSTYYLYATKSGVLWKVDLARFKATSIRLSSKVALADFAVSPTDGNLYAVGTDGKLVRIDPRKGKVTATSVAGLARGGYGATWFTAKGDLIAYENGKGPRSGTLNWIATPTRAPRVVSTQAGPSTLGNDGAAYVAAPNPAGLKVVVDVLANDGDPEGSLDRSSLRIVQPAAHGTAVRVNPDGTVTYTSASTYRGRDSFRYEVCDRATPKRCATATVNITEAPVGP